MAAIIEAWRAGLLGRDHWMRNLGAGVVVGVVAMPLAMAFAIASGATPQSGLYTALVAGLAVTLFGGSRVQIAGPTGAFVVLLAGITAKYGIQGLQIVTLMAGAMLLAFGLARLGGVIRFIPESVIIGFTTGIAIVIWVGQWQAFFGLPPVSGETLPEKIGGLIGALPQLHPATTLMGLACLVVLVAWPRIPRLGAVPSPLVALVGATVAQTVLRLPGVATIGTAFGGVPLGLPPLTLPHADWALIVALMQPAFAVALLGAIESLLSATVADGMAGTRHDSNQELVGQGIANIAAGLLGGFAATGALARTATNVRHGGDSPIAGLAHAATLLVMLVALAPLAFNVPLAALAAILFVVAFNMAGLGHLIRTARRAPRSDVAVMLVTLALTVLTDLVLAVEVGVILAMLNFLRRMASAVEVREMEGHEVAGSLPHDGGALPEGVLLYTVDGPFFFGAVDQFEQALLHTHTEPEALVISLERVPFIDLTGLQTLGEVVGTLRRRGISLALCCANADVAARLERAGITEDLTIAPTVTLAEAVASVSPAEG
ncbi:MAG: SulP family inorganic anion transporter [Coriobacteriia bacterium]|nr:SulP family inorganic anion transporter [Coriobacteriia bacterium]